MRRLFLRSLVVATLAASSSAFAVEAGSPPGTDNAPASKQTRKPKRTAVPLSAYDLRSSELPAASISPKAQQPPQSSWTGIYVGVGAGAGN